ncbi:MAG: Gfo/Idh/MocA family oxidoreductase [Planctomycetaceae bacterium]|nr:Gfo/Idh/MocA family oxidoreductase [Planctomycetaceae bacterium]
MTIPTSRREFMQATAAIGAGLWVGASTAFAKPRSPNERVQYGAIGAGGKGRTDSSEVANFGDVIALCDIDSQTLSKNAKNPKFKDPATFADYREMLDKMDGKLDAVTVSCPDHSHYPATAMALKKKIACYTQKPLTHSVWEARRLAELAAEYDVPTQMGNQGTANDGLREAAAIIKAGHLGNVTEAHIFTNRPVWEQGNPRPPSDVVPDHIDWNLWLGPAPLRPYAKGVYHDFAWRGWWDFGTGALGDMACHTFNMPYMGLDLKDPVTIQAKSSGHDGDSYPQKAQITFEFPSNDWRGPVTVTWYDGGNLPSNELIFGKEFQGGERPTGSIIKGDKATIYSPGDYAAEFFMYDNDGNEMPKPEVEYEKSPGHYLEFHQSITGERKRAVSCFENYAGKLTETILLGNLAVWTAATGEGPKVEWDAENLRSPSHPIVANIVRRQYRDGYDV